MTWLNELFTSAGGSNHTLGAAHAVLILSLVTATGLGLGTIRVFGISLGVAGVLFAGLIFGHFHLGINAEIMDFAREFGLILFVYTIGIQVGPGFFASLKRQGLPLNLMAAAVVVLGLLTTLLVFHFGMSKAEFPAAVGMFSGATTNTPSLAASTQALREVLSSNPEAAKLPALGYAVAYPFGIVGIIVSMLLMRRLFRVDLNKEAEVLAKLRGNVEEKLIHVNLEVKNPALAGVPLGEVPAFGRDGIVVSRVMHNNKPQIAHRDTVLEMGDILVAVGPERSLAELELLVGGTSDMDVTELPGPIVTRRIVVTKNGVTGKTVPDLDLGQRFGVKITRINRAEVEIPVTPTAHIQYGDSLVAVGEEESIERAAKELGNSVKQLNHPQIIPVFIGIALGVLLGSLPIALPGFPAPVKLGLAGGPLIVAILLSRINRIGPLICHIPISANFMLREVGIVLFLACVGLKSGDKFVETLTQGHGLQWMAYGALITFLPLMLVALFARIVTKLDYMSLCGMLAGSMTDPPALAFAGSMTASEAPSVAYATVYPLVMLLRVLFAQALVLFFYR